MARRTIGQEGFLFSTSTKTSDLDALAGGAHVLTGHGAGSVPPSTARSTAWATRRNGGRNVRLIRSSSPSSCGGRGECRQGRSDRTVG